VWYEYVAYVSIAVVLYYVYVDLKILKKKDKK